MRRALDARQDGLRTRFRENPAADPITERPLNRGQSLCGPGVIDIGKNDTESFGRHLLGDAAAHRAGTDDGEGPRRAALDHADSRGSQPNRRAAFSLRINGRTSSRIASFSKSASQRSGVIHG